MKAVLETVDLIRGAGTYRVESDSGLVLKSGVIVTGNIQNTTTVGAMRTAAQNDLTTKQVEFKQLWVDSLDIDQLILMRDAWDEAVVADA